MEKARGNAGLFVMPAAIMSVIRGNDGGDKKCHFLSFSDTKTQAIRPVDYVQAKL